MIDRVSFTFKKARAGTPATCPEGWKANREGGSFFQHESGAVVQTSIAHVRSRWRFEGNPNQFATRAAFDALLEPWFAILGEGDPSRDRDRHKVTRLDFETTERGQPLAWASVVHSPSRRWDVRGTGRRLETVYSGSGNRIVRIYDWGLLHAPRALGSGFLTRIEIQVRDTGVPWRLDAVCDLAGREFCRLKRFRPSSVPAFVARHLLNDRDYRKTRYFEHGDLAASCVQGIREWWGAPSSRSAGPVVRGGDGLWHTSM